MTTVLDRPMVKREDLHTFTEEIRQGRQFIKVTCGERGLTQGQAIYQELEALKSNMRPKQVSLTADQTTVYEKLRERWANLNTSRN